MYIVIKLFFFSLVTYLLHFISNLPRQACRVMARTATNMRMPAFAFQSPTMKTIVDEARFEYAIDTIEYNSSISSALFATHVDGGEYTTNTLITVLLNEHFAHRVNCRTETRSDTFPNVCIMLTSVLSIAKPCPQWCDSVGIRTSR